eukprot:2372418-Prymnesium_polylepis.1
MLHAASPSTRPLSIHVSIPVDAFVSPASSHAGPDPTPSSARDPQSSRVPHNAQTSHNSLCSVRGVAPPQALTSSAAAASQKGECERGVWADALTPQRRDRPRS